MQQILGVSLTVGLALGGHVDIARMGLQEGSGRESMVRELSMEGGK